MEHRGPLIIDPMKTWKIYKVIKLWIQSLISIL